MNDDDDAVDCDREGDGSCCCPVCVMNQRMEAVGAANMRRGFWMDVYVAAVKGGSSNPLFYATEAVKNLDKAFPEVKTAAMKEDR